MSSEESHCPNCENVASANIPSPTGCVCQYWRELCADCWVEGKEYAYGRHPTSCVCGFVPGCTICRGFQRFLCAHDETEHRNLKAAWEMQCDTLKALDLPPPLPPARLFTMDDEFKLTPIAPVTHHFHVEWTVLAPIGFPPVGIHRPAFTWVVRFTYGQPNIANFETLLDSSHII